MKYKKKIHKSIFLEHWPFKVKSGFLIVDNKSLGIWFKVKNKKYALNGNAKDIGGYNIDEIKKDHPEQPGIKMSAQIIIEVVKKELWGY